MLRTNEEARLASRPSPPYHAARMAPGTRRRGNDGLMYEVVANAKGAPQWKLTGKAKECVASCKESVTLILQPWLRSADVEGAKKACDDPRVLGGARALSVVWESLAVLLYMDENARFVRSVTFVPSSPPPKVEPRTNASLSDIMNKLVCCSGDTKERAVLCRQGGYYAVEVAFRVNSKRRSDGDEPNKGGRQRVIEDARNVYGDMAADTWMEGPLAVTNDASMYLNLSLKGVADNLRGHSTFSIV